MPVSPVIALQRRRPANEHHGDRGRAHQAPAKASFAGVKLGLLQSSAATQLFSSTRREKASQLLYLAEM